MPNYNVVLYPIVVTKVSNIEAKTMREAISKAEKLIDWNRLFDSRNVGGTNYTEFASEFASYLVDVVGDTEFSKSKWFTKNARPVRK